MKSSNPNSITNTNSSMRVIDDGIVHINWNADVELDKIDIDEVSIGFNKITNGKPVKVLSQFGQYVNIKSDAYTYAAEQSPECVALAYVITGLSQRLLIRFYIRMKKRKTLTKVFDSYEDALEWLKTV